MLYLRHRELIERPAREWVRVGVAGLIDARVAWYVLSQPQVVRAKVGEEDKG